MCHVFVFFTTQDQLSLFCYFSLSLPFPFLLRYHINISMRYRDVIFLSHPSLYSMYLTANVKASELCCVGVSLVLSRTEIIGDRQCKHPFHLKRNNVNMFVFTTP